MLKKIIKKSFNIFGLDIRRHPLPDSLHIKLSIDIIIDVGANVGQYATQARKEGYTGKIVSFEPLPQAYSVLKENSEAKANWIVAPRCALGSREGIIQINVFKNSISSSILSMTKIHSDAAPNSIYINSVKVPIIRLDSIFDEYTSGYENIYLKIDVQGYESEVLEGLSNKLQKVKAVQLELSIVELYEDQLLYDHYVGFFEKNDFKLWEIIPGFKDKRTGQLLQFDAVFVNTKLIK